MLSRPCVLTTNGCSLHAYRPYRLSIDPLLSLQPHSRIPPYPRFIPSINWSRILIKHVDTLQHGVLEPPSCHAAATATLGLWTRHSECTPAAWEFTGVRRQCVQLSGSVHEKIKHGLLHSQDRSRARIISDCEFGCGSEPEFPHRSEVGRVPLLPGNACANQLVSPQLPTPRRSLFTNALFGARQDCGKLLHICLRGLKLIQDRRCNHSTNVVGRSHNSADPLVLAWLCCRFNGHFPIASQKAFFLPRQAQLPITSPPASRNQG